MRVPLISAIALMVLPASAFALEAKVERTANADAKKVWEAVGDFCGIGNWHPAIKDCELKQEGGKTIRRLVLKNGATILEELVKYDAPGMNYTYAIVSSPLPVKNYKSTISVKPAGDKSTLTWSGTFDSEGAPDADAVKVITGIYEAGLDALAKTK